MLVPDAVNKLFCELKLFVRLVLEVNSAQDVVVLSKISDDLLAVIELRIL